MDRLVGYIILLVFLNSCSEESSKEEVEIAENSKYGCYQDSLLDVVVDTTTIVGKQQYLMNQFYIDESPSVIDYDTLIDYNYDGNDDFIIGYYGQAGTGVKNRIKAYYFKNGSYHYDTLISSLPNPTFYLKQKRLTTFYLPYGVGWGADMRWKNGTWTIYMEFGAENYEEETIWDVYYPLTGDSTKLRAPYRMEPPEDLIPFEFGLCGD